MMMNGDMETAHIQSGVNFKHSPLPNPDLYIRLVELEASDTADGVIKCNLTTWLSSETPAYQAISYTWGDADSNTHIIINGDKFRVRVNCDYALRQARWHGGSQYFWIDSICINQTDVPERNRQVARMDRVFRNAVNVLACVGPHSDNSEILMSFLGHNADFLMNANDRLATDRDPGQIITKCSWHGKKAGGPQSRPHSASERTKSQWEYSAMLNSSFQDDVHGRSSSWWRTTKRKRLHLVKSETDGIWREAPRSALQRVLPRAAKEQTSQDTEHLYYERLETTPRNKINIRHILSLWRWRLKMSLEEWFAICLSYNSMLRRSYFSRVWVMQEVLLASRISLCCGQHHQPMASLSGLSKMIKQSVERLEGLVMVFGEDTCSKAIGGSKTFRFGYSLLTRVPLIGRLVLPLCSFPCMLVEDDGPGELNRQVYGIISLSPTNVGERKLMDLDEALEVMRYLDCEDDRDRVYGALGCIDWKVFTPIVPDYTKTTYQLAVEVLQSQLGYRTTSDRGQGRLIEHVQAPETDPTRLAADLAQLLRISRLSEEIMTETKLRQLSKITTATNPKAECPETIKLCEGGEWFGYRICDDGSLDLTGHCKHRSCILREGYQRQIEHEKNLEGVKPLKSANGIHIGNLPETTRPGDWILHKWMGRPKQPHSVILSPNIVLIVRPPEHGDKWIIVGQGLIDDPWACSGKIEEMNTFEALFSAKDLLLLYMDSEMKSGWRELSAGEIRERLGTGVCYPDGSSYVHPSYIK